MKNKGWECCKCGAVMSPTYPTCWYCVPQTVIPTTEWPPKQNQYMSTETLKLCPHGFPVKFNTCPECASYTLTCGKLASA